MTTSLKAGDTVKIVCGITGKAYGPGEVIRVSPTGKRVTISYGGKLRPSAFYLNTNGSRYVNDPGCGIAGAIMNDWFAPPVETPAAPEVSIGTTFLSVSLPDFVTDHYNGDDELLVGVPVGPETTAESLLADVMSEVGQSEKIPDVITDDMIRAEIESDVSAASDVVGSLTASGVWDNHDEDSDADYEESESYAWFRISWAIG